MAVTPHGTLPRGAAVTYYSTNDCTGMGAPYTWYPGQCKSIGNWSDAEWCGEANAPSPPPYTTPPITRFQVTIYQRYLALPCLAVPYVTLLCLA